MVGWRRPAPVAEDEAIDHQRQHQGQQPMPNRAGRWPGVAKGRPAGDVGDDDPHRRHEPQLGTMVDFKLPGLCQTKVAKTPGG